MSRNLPNRCRHSEKISIGNNGRTKYVDTTLIFTGLLFGSIGMGYIIYGRKQSHLIAFLAGVGLCVFPYFISSIWVSIVLGVGLVLLPFMIRS